MGTVHELADPFVIIDSPTNNCRVSVIGTSTGPCVVIDTPTGEVKLRLQDAEWKKFFDAVWAAERFVGAFDKSEDDK